MTETQTATLKLDGRTVHVTIAKGQHGDPIVTLDPGDGFALDGIASGEYLLVKKEA